MKTWKNWYCALLLIAFSAGPAAARIPDIEKDEKEKRRELRRQERADRQERKKERYKKRRDRVVGRTPDVHPYGSLRIPAGQLPPPGECRVWYPDLPAGQQPAPQPCGTTAPPGAWLVSNEGDRYRVNIYDARKADRVDRTEYYMVR